jgi:hypothetical protein
MSEALLSNLLSRMNCRKTCVRLGLDRQLAIGQAKNYLYSAN